MANNRKKSRRCARLIIWDKVKVPLQWCTGREWPVNCMTVISARGRSHRPFQMSGSNTSQSPEIGKIAEAYRRVFISAWEFEGNIRPTNWTEGSSEEKDPAVHETSLLVTLCALSRPSSPDIEKFKPHRRTILIPLLSAPTSHKRPSRK